MALKSSTGWWTKISSYLSVSLTDVAIGLVYLVVAGWALLMAPEDSVARALAGGPLLLFVPGYAVVAALFPGRRARVTDGSRRVPLLSGDGDGEIDAVERVALSFGLSVAVVPLVTFAVYALGNGFALVPLVTALVGLSAVGLIVGGARRRRLPPDARFDPSLAAAFGRVKHAVFDTTGPFEASLNVALAGSVVLVAVVFGAAMVSPAAETPNTTMTLLTENESGAYVAGGYPTDLSTGESAELVVGVENHEEEAVDYTVVVLLQRVAVDGESLTVRASREVTRLSDSVPAGDTWYADHTVTPETAGDRIRLTYLLYRDDVPDRPSIDSSYQHSYHWLNVSV